METVVVDNVVMFTCRILQSAPAASSCNVQSSHPKKYKERHALMITQRVEITKYNLFIMRVHMLAI